MRWCAFAATNPTGKSCQVAPTLHLTQLFRFLRLLVHCVQGKNILQFWKQQSKYEKVRIFDHWNSRNATRKWTQEEVSKNCLLLLNLSVKATPFHKYKALNNACS